MLIEVDFYDGKILIIFNFTVGFLKLFVAYLRVILRRYNILEVGTKDELIVRVGFFKVGYSEVVFSRERLCILYYIIVVKEIYRN